MIIYLCIMIPLVLAVFIIEIEGKDNKNNLNED